jgi:hypothetical protein
LVPVHVLLPHAKCLPHCRVGVRFTGHFAPFSSDIGQNFLCNFFGKFFALPYSIAFERFLAQIKKVD